MGATVAWGGGAASRDLGEAARGALLGETCAAAAAAARELLNASFAVVFLVEAAEGHSGEGSPSSPRMRRPPRQRLVCYERDRAAASPSRGAGAAGAWRRFVLDPRRPSLAARVAESGEAASTGGGLSGSKAPSRGQAIPAASALKVRAHSASAWRPDELPARPMMALAMSTTGTHSPSTSKTTLGWSLE